MQQHGKVFSHEGRSMGLLRFLLKTAIVVALVIVALRLTHPLPDLPAGQPSAAVPADADTQLGAALLPLTEKHEGLSGVVPLADGRDALAARILLARAAEETIDVQYYIWQTDTTGWLLLEELRVPPSSTRWKMSRSVSSTPSPCAAPSYCPTHSISSA